MELKLFNLKNILNTVLNLIFIGSLCKGNCKRVSKSGYYKKCFLKLD